MSVSWPLTPEQLVNSPTVLVTRAETGRGIDNVGITGRGVIRPFRRDQKQDYVTGTDIELVASQIGQVLGTICHSQDTGGELPWRTEFGCLLHLVRLNNASPALSEKARAYVSAALRRWVPRARVTQVTAKVSDNKFVVSIQWRLLAEGTEKVVVPGLETEIAVG